MSVAATDQPVLRIAITKAEWQRFRIRAIERGTSAPQLLAQLVRRELAEAAAPEVEKVK